MQATMYIEEPERLLQGKHRRRVSHNGQVFELSGPKMNGRHIDITVFGRAMNVGMGSSSRYSGGLIMLRDGQAYGGAPMLRGEAFISSKKDEPVLDRAVAAVRDWLNQQ